MKRSLKLGSHILHEFVLPNTWYLVFATCNKDSTYAVSLQMQESSIYAALMQCAKLLDILI